MTFWVEVCRLVHQHGLPTTQKKLVDGMLDWFMDSGDETIDSRTVEKKVSKLFEALEHPVPDVGADALFLRQPRSATTGTR